MAAYEIPFRDLSRSIWNRLLSGRTDLFYIDVHIIDNQWLEKKYMSLETLKKVGMPRSQMLSEYQAMQIQKPRRLTAREISA